LRKSDESIGRAARTTPPDEGAPARQADATSDGRRRQAEVTRAEIARRSPAV
jgi:hypothetical protein